MKQDISAGKLLLLVSFTGALLSSCTSGGGGGSSGPQPAPGDPLETEILISDAAVVEGDAGTVEARFNVTLSAPGDGTVTVDYTTRDGTSAAGRDHIAASGTLTFTPGVTAQTVVVEVLGDLVDEADETFFVALSQPSYAILAAGAAEGLGTIRDDDPEPSVSVADAGMMEGDAEAHTISFTVTLSRASAREILVEYAARDGSAVAGDDYTPGGGTLRFAAGETVKTITVEVLADELFEVDETFEVMLRNVANASIGRIVGYGTIFNDDEPPPGEEGPGLDTRPLNPDCIVLERPPTGASVAFERPFPNLSLPGLSLFQAPGDDSRWFVIDKNGIIRSFENTPAVKKPKIVLDISARVVRTNDGGLLGLAFHPQFATNGRAFVFYNALGNPLTSYVSRFTSTDGGATLAWDSEDVLIKIEDIDVRKGGRMLFGLDGYLYISVGDGGNKEAAQDASDLRGKMLRIDVDGGDPYGIPADNPFAAGGGRAEVYASGLRNPWAWSMDRLNGEIWLGDVGSESWEEIDQIVSGGNYGWPIREGMHCFRPGPCESSGFTEPVAEFSHSEGNAIIGGYVYRGSAIPELYGVYLYGDFGSGKVWGLHRDENGQPEARLLVETGANLLSFGEDQNGEIYIISESHQIFKLVPAPPPATDTFPRQLSDLPCVNPADPSRPEPGLIPYDINVPFWSDGGVKERFLALPDGERIHVRDDGDWEFPIGTVFLKHFRLGGRLIETRLFVRHGDGEWGGYSYEWDDDQTDAELLPGEKQKIINGQTWTYPSRSQCLACHTAAAGRALGPETAQMNRLFTYPSTGRTANQLTTFAHIGLFDAPLPAPPADLPALPIVTDGGEPIEARAKSYLHANCSYCHRPEGPGGGNMDFRFNTPPSAMGACNTLPSEGDLGVPGARILFPGDAARSILSLRIHATDSERMPPIGRNAADASGAALIDAWISALSGCP